MCGWQDPKQALAGPTRSVNCSPTGNSRQSTGFNRIEEIRKLGQDGRKGFGASSPALLVSQSYHSPALSASSAVNFRPPTPLPPGGFPLSTAYPSALAATIATYFRSLNIPPSESLQAEHS